MKNSSNIILNYNNIKLFKRAKNNIYRYIKKDNEKNRICCSIAVTHCATAKTEQRQNSGNNKDSTKE